jgi:hypothetical protein
MATREIAGRFQAPHSIATAEAQADAVPDSWISCRIYEPFLARGEVGDGRVAPFARR